MLLTLSRKGLAATLLAAALGAYSTSALQDAVPAVPGDHPPATFVQVPASLALGDDATAEVFTSATKVYVDPANGESVRMLAISVTCHVGQIMLERTHALQAVSPSSDEAVDVVTDTLNTGLADLLAATRLGKARDGSDYLSAGVQVAPYQIRIEPAEGLVWGAVSTPADVVVSAEPLR